MLNAALPFAKCAARSRALNGRRLTSGNPIDERALNANAASPYSSLSYQRLGVGDFAAFEPGIQESAMKKLMTKFRKNESGATAIEYALIAGLIGVVIIAGATTLGNNVSAKLTSVGTKVTAAGGT
jgi:pilus assembly protein Flp/PilA